ncbi:MAG: hypothetical protein PHQ98_03905 [Candidatus ainarchaeum sp.]|nr:hypothetical protein [Candidatus ainarchaeum sp.]
MNKTKLIKTMLLLTIILFLTSFVFSVSDLNNFNDINSDVDKLLIDSNNYSTNSDILINTITYGDENILQNTVDSNVDSNIIIFQPSDRANYLKSQIIQLESNIFEMKKNSFTTTRLNDEIFIANQLYSEIIYNEENELKVDYETLEKRINSIKKIISIAYQNQDELKTFNESINKVDNTIDKNDLFLIYETANTEFIDERYENSLKLIEQGYEKIVELQSIESKANAVYLATTKNVEYFLNTYYIYIILAFLIPFIVYLIFKRRIRVFLLNSKLDSNKLESDVLKSQIKKTQEDYFIKNILPASEYGIKINLYSEKLRDLNRLNAMYNEELAELNKKKRLEKLLNKLKFKKI